MILVHDLVEAEIGDISYGLTFLDPKLKKEKRKKEKLEIAKIKKMIGGNLGREVYELWNEFEKCLTHEAKLVKALDSLEANHQSILFDISYWDDYFYSLALTKADDHTKHEDILEELNQEITKQMEREMKLIGLDVKKMRKQIRVSRKR